MNYIVSSLLLIILIIILAYFYKKLSIKRKKKLSEGFFYSISAISAIFIIVFIIYLLLHIYLLGQSKLTWEFLTSPPLDGLTSGGIFPAIVGTSFLVLIMSLIGVPIGTITAIYLAEYAKATSIITKTIRFAVNTLAGVPSIVFGLFGLGFFIGVVGIQLDNIEANNKFGRMQELFESNAEIKNSKNKIQITVSEVRTMLLNDKDYNWTTEIEQSDVLVELHGIDKPIPKKEVITFFKQRILPRWGQPSLIWAALTMALMTLPVVIVSVEESIKAIPEDLRLASLALGATKFRTIMKVVIPGAYQGILTGTILTISRGAGEVAPILFTGVAYYLPDLPNSISSQFMHMGYHIYVLATQSTNVEQTKPLQYATTFVLLTLTFTLNFTAILIRSRIRSKMSRFQ